MTNEAKAIMAMAKALGASIADYVPHVPAKTAADNSELAFSIDGDLLKKALSKLMRVAKSPLYLHACDNAVEFKTRGGSFIVSKKISDNVKVTSAGKFIIPNTGAKMLAKVIGDARYTFTTKNHTLTIAGGDKTLTLKEQPEQLKLFNNSFSSVEAKSENVLTLAQSELKHLLNRTLYAATKTLARSILTAVNFKAENDALILSATNGYRLAQATTNQFSLQGELNCSIDSDALRFILPLLNKGDVQISIISEDDVVISLKDLDINAKCWLEEYPDFARAIPTVNPVNASTSNSELQKALTLCKLFADEHNAISLCFERDGIFVAAERTGAGSARAGVQADVSMAFSNAAVQVNVDYLLDSLKSLGKSIVTLGLSKNGITIREENLVAVMSGMLGSVQFNQNQTACIAPPIPDKVTTIDIEAKVKVA